MPHYVWKTVSIRCLFAPEVQELFDTFHSAASDGYVGGLWTVSEIGLHRISYLAKAEIRPYFHIRPDMARPDLTIF